MSTTTKNNNSRYRNGCIGPGYKLLNIGNLFRKIGFKISKSGNSQETTDNSSLTNSDPTNSIINNNNVVTNLQTPHKVKIKSGHKDKYIPIDIPTFYNEQKEGNSSSSFQNRPKEIYQLERKVDALSNQLSQIEQMLSSLVQSPHQYLKINNSSIDNLKSNEVNDKKDCINESENITEKNSVSPTQNVNLQTSNNTTSNSKNTTNKNYNYIHYCHKCGKQKLHDEWCEKCDREIFESNFPNWTSGNEVIDNFIKETQLSATTKFNFLEWIPFSSLTNIKYIGKGGFGEVFSAEWVDGPRTKWNVEKEVWERYSNVNVALKSLFKLKEKDFTSELFKELKSHLMSNDQVVGRFNILRTYGMTRDPETKVYMIVMTLADDGDLSAYMKNHFSTLTFVKRLDILYDMATGLCQIHRSGLMHRDLHSGNVMCQRLRGRDPGRAEEYRFVIGDLGQATPPIKVNNNQVFGVLPYIAPEVLCKEPYTQAADVYSFGILMWEILTGLKAFGDVSHDSSLILSIISEARPDIPINTPKLYADLMKRCWSGNTKKRPDAHEIYSTIGTWLNQCLYVPNSKITEEFKRGDELLKTPHLQTLHPNNVLYSTYHDTTALREKLEPNKRTSAVIDNEYSSTFDSIDNSLAIPDLIYNEDSSTFDAIDNSLAIPDLIYNEDSSDFETPDSIDNADSTLEISDSLNDVADSLVKLG